MGADMQYLFFSAIVFSLNFKFRNFNAMFFIHCTMYFVTACFHLGNIFNTFLVAGNVFKFNAALGPLSS